MLIMFIKVLEIILLACVIGFVTKGQSLRGGNEKRIKLSIYWKMTAWVAFIGGALLVIPLVCADGFIIEDAVGVMGFLLPPVACVGGAIGIFLYDGWYIIYDENGFEYRSCFWKKQYLFYDDVVKMERKNERAYLYTETGIIKFTVSGTVNTQFFFKNISDCARKRKLKE